jgi:hypothetical protein
MLDFDPEKMKEYFRAEFEKGRAAAQEFAAKKTDEAPAETATV